jgi:hypothetical protein
MFNGSPSLKRIICNFRYISTFATWGELRHHQAGGRPQRGDTEASPLSVRFRSRMLRAAYRSRLAIDVCVKLPDCVTCYDDCIIHLPWRQRTDRSPQTTEHVVHRVHHVDAPPEQPLVLGPFEVSTNMMDDEADSGVFWCCSDFVVCKVEPLL